jgi:hypothetical protein
MKNTLLKTSVLLICCVLLNGCSEARSKLGLDRAAPDEFTVISYPDLVVPPTFDLDATPPKATAISPNRLHNTQGEAALLNTIQANLRSISSQTETEALINREYRLEKKKTAQHGIIRGTLSKIRQGPEDEALDAKFEEDRLNGAMQNGEPINNGPIKTQQGERSTLSRLFGW